jgi:hypothetical protein
MPDSYAAFTADARRAHVEALLSAYPDVTPQEHELLVDWFRKDASALDIGMVASNPAAERGYRRFRAEHIDRFTINDMGRALAFAAAIAVAVLLIAWRAL